MNIDRLKLLLETASEGTCEILPPICGVSPCQLIVYTKDDTTRTIHEAFDIGSADNFPPLVERELLVSLVLRT